MNNQQQQQPQKEPLLEEKKQRQQNKTIRGESWERTTTREREREKSQREKNNIKDLRPFPTVSLSLAADRDIFTHAYFFVFLFLFVSFVLGQKMLTPTPSQPKWSVTSMWNSISILFRLVRARASCFRVCLKFCCWAFWRRQPTGFDMLHWFGRRIGHRKSYILGWEEREEGGGDGMVKGGHRLDCLSAGKIVR